MARSTESSVAVRGLPPAFHFQSVRAAYRRYRSIFEGFDLSEPLSPDQYQQLMTLLLFDLPDTAHADSIRTGLSVLTAQSADDRWVEFVCRRLAGLVPGVRSGLNVNLTPGSGGDGWNMVHIIDVERAVAPWRTLSNRITARSIEGSQAGNDVELFGSSGALYCIAQCIGFSRRGGQKFRYHGKRDLVNLLAVVYLYMPTEDVQSSLTNPYLTRSRVLLDFDQRDKWVKGSAWRRNRTIIRGRKEECCQGLNDMECHRCTQGSNDCPFACRHKTIVVSVCQRCHTAGAIDPVHPEACIRCRREQVNREIAEISHDRSGHGAGRQTNAG